MLRRVALGLFSAIALCCATNSASAQALTVMPVVIDLQPGQLAATLSISGQGGSETSYQVRAFAWSQDGDTEKLDPTEDLLVSPPLGVIPANATQIVRLVVRKPAQNKEAVFRILLDQIPPPSEPGTVRIAVRLSLPVFVQPATRIAPHLQWRIERDGENAWLVVTNDGTRHERVHDVVLTSGSTTLKVEGDASPYVLAGVTRRFRLSGSGLIPQSGAELHLTAQSNAGKIDVPVRVAQKP